MCSQQHTIDDILAIVLKLEYIVKGSDQALFHLSEGQGRDKRISMTTWKVWKYTNSSCSYQYYPTEANGH